MANELRATYTTGETLYCLVFNAAGQVWDQTNDGGNGSFEAYAAASIDNYDIALAEIAAASTQYRGTFPPNIATGAYSVVCYLQAGANPVVANDERIGESAPMYWDSTANIEINRSTMDVVLDTIAGDVVNIDGIVPNSVVPDVAGTAATPAEVATALTNIGLDHLLAVAVADEVVDNSIIAKLVSKDATADWSDYAWTTESLEALKDGILNTIAIDVAGINGDAMRGTDGVSLVVPDAAGVIAAYILSAVIGADSDTLEILSDEIDVLEARLTAARAGYLDELAAANLPSDIDAILLDTGTTLPASLVTIADYVDSLETSAALIQNYVDTVETTLALIVAKTNLITTGQILISSPVAADNEVTIVQGDDYLAANGTDLEWTSEAWTSPDLTSATAKLRFITKTNYDAGVQTAALEVDVNITWTGSGNDAIFTADLTAAQTMALSSPTPPNDKYSYIYQLQVTTDAGKKITVALGSVYVKQEII